MDDLLVEFLEMDWCREVNASCAHIERVEGSKQFIIKKKKPLLYDICTLE